MGSLTVLDGGLFTTIQDGGREGFRKFGVPRSGVMDELAYEYANRLVNNSDGSPVLECTLKGGKYCFESNAVIAVTGASMSPKINGNKVEMYSSLEVKEGDILELGFAQKGCRSYVAISGEWNIKKVMGSFSTYTQGGFGGFKGRTLQKGDILKWRDKDFDSDFKNSSLAKDKIPYYSSKVTVKFVVGPEWKLLSKKEQDKFLSTEFKISSESNRMGLRLNAKEAILIDNPEMSSSGVIPGIIQLPPNGNPIILMKDGQTVGGYPRIGKVLGLYLDRLAQIPPNGIVRFKKSEGF
jgi:biotin-dependent carboxylase-like uncharacterized protein